MHFPGHHPLLQHTLPTSQKPGQKSSECPETENIAELIQNETAARNACVLKLIKKRTLLISSGTHKYKKQMVKEAM